MVIVRTFPNYPSNPKGSNFALFCKYQLLKYKPWQTVPDNVWNNTADCEENFVSCWNEFLETDIGQLLVPEWKHEMDNISTYFEVTCDSNDFQEPSTDEREEWMFLTDLYSENPQMESADSDASLQYWQENRHVYTDEQIGSMPCWTEKQKDGNVFKRDDSYKQIGVSSLNYAQHLAYTIVFDHYLQNSENQLLLIITGLAGSGKSYVIDAIKNLLKQHCKVCSFFGMAASNVKGQTLHSLLQLPIRGKKCAELKGQSLQRLQNQLEGIQYLIINEYSVIGQKMLGWIGKHCKQATGKYTVPFGGISVVLVGDIAQLPPITDKVVYDCKPCDELSTEGFCEYQKFDNVVKLTVNERAKGASSDQETF